MQLRPATPADALEVARVHIRAWQVGYRGLLPDSFLDGLSVEDRAARYTFGHPDPARPATLVAVDDGGAICGFVTTGPGELMALYVEPERWSQGIGRALVAAARERLAQRGDAEAVLWVLDGNQRGARFYVADGWSPDGEQRTEVIWGLSMRSFRYRRRLP